MAEKKTSLRVLYTINSSVQYILARSYAPVPVAVIPPIEDETPASSSTVSKSEPLYASVSLRTCLDTICRSSPELTMVDNTRDFSIYVLDPLESNSAPPPVCITNSSGDTALSAPPPDHPRGVAVGLGLMSWALMEDEEAAVVVGTLVKQGTRQEALEVIFSLRETAGMKKPQWGISLISSQPPSSQESVSSFSSSKGEEASLYSRQSVAPSIASHSNPSYHDEATRETLASIQQRSRPKTKPPKTARLSTVPVTGSDKLMDADTYIGPTKKKGRPKTTNAEPKSAPFQHNAIASGSGLTKPEVIVIDSDGEGEGGIPIPTSGIQPPSSGVTVMSTKSKRSKQHPATPPFPTDPLVRCSLQPSETFAQVKVEPEESDPGLGPLLLSNQGVTPENFEYLSVISSMDSADPHFIDKRYQDPAVAYLLKQFVANFRATHAAPTTVASAPTPPAPPPLPPSHSPQERRRSSSSSQSDIIILDKENVNPVAFKKSAGKDSYDGGCSDPAIPVMLLSRQNSHSDRSRGLGGTSRSNEQQSAMVSTNQPTPTSRFGRKRTLSDTMDEKERRNKGKQRGRGERRDDHRHSSSQLPRPSASTDALRHYPRFRDLDQPRVEQPSNYYRTPLESWTSPPRLPPERHETGNATPEPSCSTSPIRPPTPQLPRVSASSPVRAPRQSIRKGYSVPAWAVTNTATQPRLSEDAQRSLAELAEKKKQEKRERSKLKRNRSSSMPQSSMRPPEAPAQRVPKPAEPLRGPIAASNAGPLIASTTTIAFPIVASSRPSSPPLNPIAIPKTPKTPMRNRSVRATPGGENDSLFTPGPASGSLFGSAYSRHSPQGSPPSYLTSPLGNRKKQRLSSSSDRSPKPLTYLADSEDRQEVKTAPEREAEDALDDPTCPPDSLPIASSDIDVDVPQQTSVDERTSVDDDPTTPVKQHWPGLPPSSPPPPSSPMLQPESDDEMAEVPIATSDSEADADMSNFEWDATSPTGNSPAYSNDQFTTPMDNDIFSFFSADGPYQSLDQHVAFPSMDLFEQYTHLNAQSDDLQAFAVPADSNLGVALGNGLGSLDFGEFFNAVGPLVENSIHPPPQSTNDDLGPLAEGDNNSFGEVDIDHAKFSADMRALLGGCVL
ncbi:hypothetical protein NLJ89_g3922 [Agrocybe chaxingu]|uniref:Uncharacterized protein n=1 Tax=Agrocybe chaxingu TaxID=84603 RepID=A0A9W8MYA3_9AGAR|nr:hypothetical protein NLJ89_g3922 [Agrocybe chaxingu]